jgi:hypothetical protein
MKYSTLNFAYFVLIANLVSFTDARISSNIQVMIEQMKELGDDLQ